MRRKIDRWDVLLVFSIGMIVGMAIIDAWDKAIETQARVFHQHQIQNQVEYTR